MIIFPAIDIKNGQCVRLYKGDFATAEKVADDHMSAAASFLKNGAQWIHMVDLDGAVEGKRCNADVILDVAAKTEALVQVGGGIRDMKTIEYYLSGGVSRIILGSAAIDKPKLVADAVSAFQDRIAVGIDAVKGYARTKGWIDDGAVHYLELAKRMEEMGVRTIIYTDIDRDGTLSGPNCSELDQINAVVSCDIIASGGIQDIEDIKNLYKMNLYGAICGKSIYSGSLDLKEAIAFCMNGEKE